MVCKVHDNSDTLAQRAKVHIETAGGKQCFTFTEFFHTAPLLQVCFNLFKKVLCYLIVLYSGKFDTNHCM